jgi:methionyl-tRNA synthetase
MNLARTGNKYLADQEPWKVFATNPQRVSSVLYVSLQVTASLAALMEPFLPVTSEKLFSMLGLKKQTWKDFYGRLILRAGHQLNKPELLFEKIEDETVERQVRKLADSKISNESPHENFEEAKPVTSFDDFQKMDIRVGTILTAERVPKTDKLLKLTIDTGIDKRTVVSGIAKYYEPEKIIGQKVTILINLEPRKIKGIESQGMILMAENPDGELSFVLPEKNIRNGASIK